MYRPRLFDETDPERLFGLIEEYSFGMLVVPDASGPEIAHLPFVLDRTSGPHGTLFCHVARPNRAWQLAADGRTVTCVFPGPHGYVSPRWYEHPAQEVPTWNYAVVHAHGRARTPLPADELRALLGRLAAAHERGAERPWTLESTEPGFVDELLGSIVGLAIPIDRLEGKLKLSQNRSPVDRARVREALAARGNPDDLAMLRWMPGAAGARASGPSGEER